MNDKTNLICWVIIIVCAVPLLILLHYDLRTWHPTIEGRVVVACLLFFLFYGICKRV